jgi:hypothetical protein
MSKIASTFLPIIKPELRKEFLEDWGKWFVLEETIRNEKTPGFMKSKLSQNGFN